MKKVLVIDDTKNIRLLLTKCLQLEGYDVTTASDGKEAIELFKNNNFDLAFLDIKLPEVRGTEVLKRIRALGIQTPVIIITAYATVKNAVDCTHMGAVAYIQKPFTAEKIKQTLTELYGSQENMRNFTGIQGNIIEEIKSLMEEHSYTQSLDLLKKAIANDLTNPELFLLVSKTYKGLGDNKNAEKFYKVFELLGS